MITTSLTKLTADSGMVLTDGEQFTHSVLSPSLSNTE